MKTYKDLANPDAVLRAYKTALKSSKDNAEIRSFEQNFYHNIMGIVNDVVNVSVIPQEVILLRVTEPKVRIVQAPKFRDKIIQNLICDEYLYEELSKTFIKDSYSSIVGKGTHYGLNRVSGMMESYYDTYKTNEGWVWKADIHHYFNSIRHDLVKQVVRKLIHDDQVYELVCRYIDAYDASMVDVGYIPPETLPPDNERFGIPLGLRQNQLIANAVLSRMCHRIKEKYRIKWYGRYMDDFFIIHHDKEELKKIKYEIETWLKEEMYLETNGKSKIFPLSQGLDFLGFNTRLKPDGQRERKLRKRSKQKMRRKLKSFKKLVADNKMPLSKAEQCYQSWRGHAQHGSTQALLKKYDLLFQDVIWAAEEAEMMRIIERHELEEDKYGTDNSKPNYK